MALSFLVFAIDGLRVSAFASQQGIAGLHQIEWTGVIVLSALLMFIAIWLIFGLRSRVVATMGLVIFAGQLAWFHTLGLHSGYCSWHLIISAALALPLWILGGGPFAISRRGWQVPV